MNTRVDKHFIIAAYYFPPLGMAGTARPLAMANFFAEQRFEVTVLTVKPIAYPVHDQTQLELLHPNVKVYRAGSSDPARLARMIPLLKSLIKLRRHSGGRKSASSLIFPDSKVGFVKPAATLLKTLIRNDKQNILITTSPPVSIHQLGLNMAGQETIRWIADFRDIWGSLSLEDQSDAFRAKAELYLRDITDAANLITATSPLTIDYLQTEINAAADYHFLPNGYDESDFATPIAEPNQSLGLYGTLNHLIGIEKLFDWISVLRKSTPNLHPSIRHVGYLDLPNLDDLLTRHGMRDDFLSVGYLPHHESIQAVRCHAANIIMLSDELDTSYIIPSKLFELLRAEPPLLAILPPGNAARLLLEEYNFSNVFVIDNAAELGDALNRLRSYPTPQVRVGVARFERRQEMSALLTRLEELL
jgi:glycosyltransferase involved in cell wall biosynthesis